jgi:type I restriction enzyme S subunit
MSEIKDIPKHWEIKKLGEVANYLNGRAFKPTEWENSGKPIIRIQNLNKEGAVYNYSNKDFEDRYKVKKGDLLYAWAASLGVYIWNGENAWLNQHIFKVEPKNNSDKLFLFYFLEKVTAELYSKAHGSGMVHVTKGKFEATEIPLPPLSEQQAIVAKIEQLLSELNNGKQQLLTAQQQLKVYRQSLLKWAFEGNLTNKKVKEGELPKGWKWVELKDLTSVLGDGLHGTPKYSETGDYYFINGNNLNDGKIEIKENTKRVSFEEFNKYKKSLNENTIFVSINGSLGYTAFYNNEKVVLGKSACYFNVLDSVNKYYIRYFLTSSSFSSYALKNATGSTIKNVGLKTMRELQIPIPPTLKEQQNIVEELESKLTVCDKIEETISQSLQQAETLRQSILKKAFEGRLV